MVIATSVTKHRVTSAMLYLVLTLLALLTLYPFLFMVQSSLRSTSAFLANPFGFPTSPLWSNYSRAASSIWRYGLNSLIVTGATVVITVASASTLAYATGRLRFQGREAVFYISIAMMMVPFFILLVPLFLWLKQLGILNTYQGLVLPYSAFNLSLAIFILRRVFEDLDEVLFEACRIDGGSEWTAFWRIAVPLARPIIGTVAFLTAIATWNDFLLAFLTLTNPSLFTLPLGEVEFTTRYSVEYGPLMAAYTIGSAPLVLLFVFVNRSFIASFSRAKLKV